MDRHAKVEGADPFASYLSSRPPASPSRLTPHSPTTKRKLWPHNSKALPPQAVTYKGDRPNPDEDPFASFLSLRPVVPDTSVQQRLCEDVLRAKRQLLEVAIQAELRCLDTATPSEMAEKLQQTRKARRYLRHPERVAAVLSDSEDDTPPASTAQAASTTPMVIRVQDADEAADEGSKLAVSRKVSLTVETSFDKDARKSSRKAQSMTDLRSLGSKDSASQRGGSKDSRRGLSKDAADNVPGGARVALPAIAPEKQALLSPGLSPIGSKRRSPSSPALLSRPEEVPLLGAWYSVTRLWNVTVTKRGQLAKRHHLDLPGGAVVLGDGRAMLYTGSHLLSPGYFFSFQITGIDDLHYPKDSVKGLQFAFGFSRLPAHDKLCERPQYAYEIPGTILVGYGNRVIDEGKWYRQANAGWEPKELELRDEVGVLLTPDGDLVVFVNREQVLRVTTSFATEFKSSPMGADASSPMSPTARLRKIAFYPVIDLHGRVSAVTLNARKGPPNVALKHKNKIKLG